MGFGREFPEGGGSSSNKKKIIIIVVDISCVDKCTLALKQVQNTLNRAEKWSYYENLNVLFP